MKADEPYVPPVKYGLPASESDRLIERHVQVTTERLAIDRLLFELNLSKLRDVLPGLRRG